MTTKPVSRGARELVEKIACKYPIECADLSQAAALIDSELRELLETARICTHGPHANGMYCNESPVCTESDCQFTKLAALLTKWKVEG